MGLANTWNWKKWGVGAEVSQVELHHVVVRRAAVSKARRVAAARSLMEVRLPEGAQTPLEARPPRTWAGAVECRLLAERLPSAGAERVALELLPRCLRQPRPARI